MGTRLAISFAAGFVSVITPCVLPIVPGYLSALSGVEANRFGESGVARRVVTSSLPFVALLPVPERILAPGLLGGARRSGSGFLLGGAFAVCAAPCIGTVLAAVLVLASDTGTVVKGAVLLAAYALGLAAAFLLAGIAFARAMGAFRWLRDRYHVIQVVSGAI